MKAVLISLLTLVLSGCAEEDKTKLATSEDLIAYMSASASMSSATEAYCAVQFYDPLNPGQLYELEEGSLVACGGVQATDAGSYYYSYFPHSADEPVLLSIVRPKAGATIIRYIEIQ